jgi:phosphate uptake regulator
MKRKIMKMAGTTYVVSIPLKWANKYNLKKGDEVDIDEDNGNLVMKLGDSPDIKRSKIKINATKSFHRRILHFLYKMGYDEIHIKFNNSDVLKTIEASIPNLSGFEIVDQGSDFCILNNLSIDMVDKFDQLLRRCFLNIKHFSAEIYNSMNSGEIEKLNEIMLIEKNIDRISDYLLRYIKRKGSKYVGKDFFLYAIIRDLEKLGDFYRDFCKILLKKNNLSSELINALENVNKYFNQFYELFYSKSDQIDFMYKDYKNVSKKLAQISINNSNFELIHLLKEIMYTIEHLIGPYYEYAFIENSS